MDWKKNIRGALWAVAGIFIGMTIQMSLDSNRGVYNAVKFQKVAMDCFKKNGGLYIDANRFMRCTR